MSCVWLTGPLSCQKKCPEQKNSKENGRRCGWANQDNWEGLLCYSSAKHRRRHPNQRLSCKRDPSWKPVTLFTVPFVSSDVPCGTCDIIITSLSLLFWKISSHCKCLKEHVNISEYQWILPFTVFWCLDNKKHSTWTMSYLEQSTHDSSTCQVMLLSS